MKLVLLAILLLLSAAAFAKSPDVEIQLHDGNKAEKQGQRMIENFLKKKILPGLRLLPPAKRVEEIGKG